MERWERATWTEKPGGSGERIGRRANQYQKSGKKLDTGKGCVRFKSLEDLALDVVGRTVARVSVAEHMANYQAARALLKKGNSERVRERGSSAKKGVRQSAVKKAKRKK